MPADLHTIADVSEYRELGSLVFRIPHLLFMSQLQSRLQSQRSPAEILMQHENEIYKRERAKHISRDLF